jgi:hypothetical protein
MKALASIDGHWVPPGRNLRTNLWDNEQFKLTINAFLTHPLLLGQCGQALRTFTLLQGPQGFLAQATAIDVAAHPLGALWPFSRGWIGFSAAS